MDVMHTPVAVSSPKIWTWSELRQLFYPKCATTTIDTTGGDTDHNNKTLTKRMNLYGFKYGNAQGGSDVETLSLVWAENESHAEEVEGNQERYNLGLIDFHVQMEVPVDKPPSRHMTIEF